MKTTVEIPDTLFRSAKARAAQEGLSLKIFFERAITSQLSRKSTPAPPPSWKRSFGQLKDIKAAAKEVQRTVDREFSRIDRDTWK